MNVADIGAAMRARDAGMKSASDHAESDAPGWGERAYQAVISNPYLPKFSEFTMDRAREWLYGCGLDYPPDERAFGAVTQRLIRDGIIEPVGFARAASSNYAFKRTYRLVRAV